MASSPNTTQAPLSDGDTAPRRIGICLRMIAWVTAFAIGLPPLPLLAASWDAAEAKANPFAWPQASVPLPAQIPGKYTPRRAFPGFVVSPAATPYVAEAPAEEPWLPGDLDPIAPPDGMPVQGNPAGLALLENAVGNGIVVGEVSDATSLDPVPGALVEIVGTGRTVEADAQGRFQFGGLPAGTFNIEASQLGYFTDTTVVTVVEGSPSEVRFGLRARPTDDSASEYMLEEESIIGDYQGESAGDFNLNLALDSPALASTIGREEFTKTGVSDAGEAIAKISGANIVDGKYAVVRGLADRYITTTFNGAQIASADPSRKAVQLDLFPTSAIEAIKVDKTYRPDLSGDFGGGAIDIITRAFPEERILQLSSKVTYNDSLEDKIFTHPNRKLNVFGDIGEEMPSSLETTNADGDVVFKDERNTSQDELGTLWRELHDSQDFRPKETDSQLGYSSSLTYGETFVLPNEMKLGLMTAFSHSTGDSSNTTDVTNQVRDYVQDEFSRSVEWSAYVSGGLKINEDNSIQATYFNKHIAQDDVINNYFINDDEENLNYGIHIKNSAINSQNLYGPDYIYYGESWDVIPLERDLEIFQIKGSHRLNERGPRMDWSYTPSNSVESRPHSTHFEFGVLDFSSAALAPQIAQAAENREMIAVLLARELGLTNPDSYTWESIEQPLIDLGLGGLYDDIEQQNTIIPDDSRLPIDTLDHSASASIPGKQLNTRRSEKTTEEAEHRQLNLALPYYFSDDKERFIELGFGGSSLTKKRVTTARAYNLLLTSTSPGAPGINNGSLSGPGGLGEDFATNPTIISDYLNGSDTGNPYILNDLTRNGLENINTELEQISYYYNFLLRYDSSFLSLGARYEEETYSISIAPTPLSAYSIEQIDGNGWEQRDALASMLPAVSTGTSLLDGQMDLLFAWSQTVSRPTFWEFIPSQTVDQTSGLGRRGNNALGQTEIDNFDLAVTWRPTEDTSISASVFHKNLLGPLVTFYENGTLLYADSYRNESTNTSDKFTANLGGIELEAELSDVGPFSFRGNFTYINAQLDYFYVQNGQPVPVTSQLPYQPAYIANLTVGYEYEPWALNANLVYNYNGDYPIILPLTPEDSEVLRNSIHTFDLILSKVIETDDINYTIKAGVKNIFGAVDTYVYRDEIYNSDVFGRSFWLEVQVNF